MLNRVSSEHHRSRLPTERLGASQGREAPVVNQDATWIGMVLVVRLTVLSAFRYTSLGL